MKPSIPTELLKRSPVLPAVRSVEVIQQMFKVSAFYFLLKQKCLYFEIGICCIGALVTTL